MVPSKGISLSDMQVILYHKTKKIYINAPVLPACGLPQRLALGLSQKAYAYNVGPKYAAVGLLLDNPHMPSGTETRY